MLSLLAPKKFVDLNKAAYSSYVNTQPYLILVSYLLYLLNKQFFRFLVVFVFPLYVIEQFFLSKEAFLSYVDLAGGAALLLLVRPGDRGG